MVDENWLDLQDEIHSEAAGEGKVAPVKQTRVGELERTTTGEV